MKGNLMTRSLPLITALLLSAAVPARAAGSPPIIDTAYWTEQPYCSGRYQLRPARRPPPQQLVDRIQRLECDGIVQCMG